MAKITQTAGRNALGTFAPEFAHFNDDVLFGENWNNEDIDLKTRSIITVVAPVSYTHLDVYKRQCWFCPDPGSRQDKKFSGISGAVWSELVVLVIALSA